MSERLRALEVYAGAPRKVAWVTLTEEDVVTALAKAALVKANLAEPEQYRVDVEMRTFPLEVEFWDGNPRVLITELGQGLRQSIIVTVERKGAVT